MVMRIHSYPGCCRMKVINTVGPVHGTKRKANAALWRQYITGAWFVDRGESPHIFKQWYDDHGQVPLFDYQNPSHEGRETRFYQMLLLSDQQSAEIKYAQDSGFQFVGSWPDGYGMKREFQVYRISEADLWNMMRDAIKNYSINVGRAVCLTTLKKDLDIESFSKAGDNWTYGFITDDDYGTDYKDEAVTIISTGVCPPFYTPIEQAVKTELLDRHIVKENDRYFRQGIERPIEFFRSLYCSVKRRY